MPEQNLPAWTVRLGAEVRDRTEQLPINEPYLADVTELLRVIWEREAAERRRRRGVEEW
jgi:hypothetical protein